MLTRYHRNISTTTVDDSGFFSFDWKPDSSGKYTVIAAFDGSKAYYSSYAQTAFVIDESPEPTVTTTQQSMLTAYTYFVPAVAGIIIAIAIVGILLALLLLKEKTIE